ncbi:MAG TPA: hypothetical protein VMK65_04420 [Longimicrobiales bacterium]|nr:hypothetical protein [Longimicrobiales bacterium]
MTAEGGSAHPRLEHVAGVVGGVVAEAVRTAGAHGVVVLDDGSPEARLTVAWCTAALPPGTVQAVTAADADGVDSALQNALGDDEDGGPAAVEAHRAAARLVAARRGALLAAPLNKSALLLAAAPVPEPLLPLGDLWAHQVEALAGAWSGPPRLRRLADAAGGIALLDRALMRWCEGRAPLATALAALPSGLHAELRQAVEEGRFARRYAGLVPKLTVRTVGVDLFA